MDYLGIDIGGTKTLVASLDERGVIKEELRFPTPSNYKAFLVELNQNIIKLTAKNFGAAGVGVPGRLNREHGVVVALGNLPWENVPFQKDVQALLNCPVVIENDAKLAGLSEAMLLKNDYEKVLYITVSTGIGIGIIEKGKINVDFGEGGGKTMILEHDGKMIPWESFASGKAIVERFGKRAEDIHDAKTWRIIAHDLALGLIDLIAIAQPDVIVFGGGVGQFLPRFGKFLRTELKRYENPMLPIPPIREAGRPEQAVIYGCYDLARATYG